MKLGMHNGIQQSEQYWRRTSGLIPCGTQCLSKGPTQFVDGVAPKYLVKGDGCKVWDVDGNALIDFGMGLGAVSLGYNYPAVNEAIKEQLQDAITLTLMHPLEVEVAELLRDVIPCAESVRFAKNGSDVTTAAVKVARAYTSKDIVLCCGYHGWHDWYAITTERHTGVPQVMDALTRPFAYNDIDGLNKLVERYRGKIAAVIMEPVGVEMPKDDFLSEVREITRQNDILLIFDEVLTGFRLSLGGAQHRFGVEPDLATFGKAVANGMPLSVLAGKTEVMSVLEQAFFSSTFGGEMLSLAAAKAAILEMKQKDSIAHLYRMGKKLINESRNLIAQHSLESKVAIKGPEPKSLFVYPNDPQGLWIKSYLQQQMLAKGILFTSYNYLSYSHQDEEINFTLRALDESLSELSTVLKQGKLEESLKGKPVRGVFRKA